MFDFGGITDVGGTSGGSGGSDGVEGGIGTLIALIMFVVFLAIIAALVAAWNLSGQTPPNPTATLCLRLAGVLGVVEGVLLALRWAANRFL